MVAPALPAETTYASPRYVRFWPFGLYALTGFTGVLAEQGFEKYMSLLVGATAAASSVVICAYFLGFAVGSWAIGALLRRGVAIRPLRTYAGLELLAGIACIAFSYGFHGITDVLGPIQNPEAGALAKFSLRFLLGTMLVLPAAALMGASFPLIAHAVDRRNDSQGSSWVRAYSYNLLGALAAAFFGAYFILPAVGIRGALWICFAIGCLVCIVAFALGRDDDQVQMTPHRERGSIVPGEAWLLLAGAFACGLIFFALEVLWTHLIATTIGCSVYAFAAMLTGVLLGLWIGAARMERRKNIQYSGTFLLCALLLLVQFRLWDWSQIAYLVDLPAALRGFFAVEMYKLCIALVLIVPSAAILGSIYPSLVRHPMLDGRSWLIGYLGTANSLGCLTGTVLGIFVMIPMIGSEWSMKLIIAAVVLLGIAFIWRETAEPKQRIAGVIGMLVVLGLTAVFHWEKLVMTSGINTYFGSHTAPSTGVARKMELVYFHEDAQGGMTTVLQFTTPGTGEKEQILFSDGKFEGSDNLQAQGLAQIGFAAIPSLYTRNFDRALLIGLGTGHSALALSRTGYRQIEIAEFAPGIIGAARTRFAQLNRDVLKSPYVKLEVEDGRHVLLAGRGRDYDLITTEIASIWFAGATNVYSREFYELARNHLRPGGALQQWVQFHHISPREIASAIATTRSVFPYVSVWYAGRQGMIVATMQPQIADAARQAMLVERLGSLAQPDLVRDLLHSRVLDSQAVDRLIAAERPVINTDHNRWIEYATPRYNPTSDDWTTRNLAWLRRY